MRRTPVTWWQTTVLAACLGAFGWAIINVVGFYADSKVQAYQISEMHESFAKGCK